MTALEKEFLDAMAKGGSCRMILHHQQRGTERPLSFELDPGDSQDPEVAQQILDEIQGYTVHQVYVNGKLAWQAPHSSAKKAIVFDADKVKVSY